MYVKHTAIPGTDTLDSREYQPGSSCVIEFLTAVHDAGFVPSCLSSITVTIRPSPPDLAIPSHWLSDNLGYSSGVFFSNSGPFLPINFFPTRGPTESASPISATPGLRKAISWLGSLSRELCVRHRRPGVGAVIYVIVAQ